MSEPIKKLTVAALSEKLEKFMSNLQIAQQKTDSTSSIMMNEIQEIRKSQEYLGSKYEEIKDELKTIQNINKNLEHENAILKQTVASLHKQSAETEAKVNNLEQHSRRCCQEIQGIPYKDNEIHRKLLFIWSKNLVLTSQDQKSIKHTG